jgi:hypothetical protein
MGWTRILLLTSQAFSYPTPVDFTGSLLRWDRTIDMPRIYVEVIGDSEAGTFGSMVTESATLWNNVPGSFLRIESFNDESSAADITITIKSALDNMPDTAGFSEFDEFDVSTPTHCNIEVLAEEGASLLSLKKTILHELGHCIGLGHSLIPEAIMSYSLNQNTFALDIDDKAAVARLYPSDGSKPELPLGCSTIQTTNSVPKPVTLMLMLLPLLMPLFLLAKAGSYARRARNI